MAPKDSLLVCFIVWLGIWTFSWDGLSPPSGLLTIFTASFSDAPETLERILPLKQGEKSEVMTWVSCFWLVSYLSLVGSSQQWQKGGKKYSFHRFTSCCGCWVTEDLRPNRKCCIFAPQHNITLLQCDCSALHWMMTETQCSFSSYKLHFHRIMIYYYNWVFSYGSSQSVFFILYVKAKPWLVVP